MLTATAPAVKFPTSSTPELAACARALDKSLATFWTLVERLGSAADRREPIHDVEHAIFRSLLAMGLDLLKAFLALAGDGDVGPELSLAGDAASDQRNSACPKPSYVPRELFFAKRSARQAGSAMMTCRRASAELAVKQGGTA